MAPTQIGDVATYPLVLTTIRCVEHFQGGPTTRNNWWNVEAEPEPWIELNSVDAQALGIKNGDPITIAGTDIEYSRCQTIGCVSGRPSTLSSICDPGTPHPGSAAADGMRMNTSVT